MKYTLTVQNVQHFHDLAKGTQSARVTLESPAKVHTAEGQKPAVRLEMTLFDSKEIREMERIKTFVVEVGTKETVGPVPPSEEEKQKIVVDKSVGDLLRGL